MSKEDMMEFSGVILECLPDTQFLVQLDESKYVIQAYASGKMRRNHIKILEGDKVTIEMSSYDLTKGRITFRQK